MQFLKTNCKEGENEAERNETERNEKERNEKERNEKEDPFPTGNEPSDIFNSK